MAKFFKNINKFFSNLFKKKVEPVSSIVAPLVVVPKYVEELKLNALGRVSWLSKGKFLTRSGRPSHLVVHYTVSGRSEQDAINVCKYFETTPDKLGFQLACPVMSESGNIYFPKNWDIYGDRNNHAGKSSWGGVSNLSSVAVGIEICSWGKLDRVTSAKVPEQNKRVANKFHNVAMGTYEKFTQAQENSLVALCFDMKKNCPEFSFDNVVGHDEIAQPLGRKTDPGGSLSMSMPEFREHLKSLWAQYKGIS